MQQPQGDLGEGAVQTHALRWSEQLLMALDPSDSQYSTFEFIQQRIWTLMRTTNQEQNIYYINIYIREFSELMHQ